MVKKKRVRKGGARTLEEPKIRPHWKDVLLAVYNHEPVGRDWIWGKTIFINGHPLAKLLGISGEELIHSLTFLKNHGLIKPRSETTLIELTEKGFDLAGRIEERRETRLYRLSSLLFSGILALTLLITLINQMNLVDSQLLLTLYIIALVVMLVFTFWRTPFRKSTKK